MINKAHSDQKSIESDADLVFYGLLSIYLNFTGIGFLVLRKTRKRNLGKLPHDRDSVMTKVAIGLAIASIVLFWMTWAGFTALLIFHRF
jgi:hypothetical protein